jgi:hypothetical protein
MKTFLSIIPSFSVELVEFQREERSIKRAFSSLPQSPISMLKKAAE